MLRYILYLILITLVPAIELRGSIPYGMLVNRQLHWLWVVVICTVANIAIGFVVYFLIEYVIKAMTHLGPVHRWWTRYVERTQKKIHASVEKYGEWGLAIFIGVPLPGTGAYTGALAAYLLGMSFKKFAVANILGVVIAGVIVTVVCLTGSTAFSIFVKKL